MEPKLNEQWIVAIVSPRDIAVHPNFPEGTYIAPRVLASRLKGWDFALRDLSEITVHFAEEERELLRASEEAFRIGHQVADARWALRRLCRSDDLCLATAATLFLAVSLADADEYTALFQVLEDATRRLEGVDAPEVTLCRALIHLQRALRQAEAGELDSTVGAEALSLVQSIEPERLPLFTMSPGVEWDSFHGWVRVLRELESVAVSHLSALSSPFDQSSWAQAIRREQSPVQSEFSGAASDGLEKYIDERFNLITKDPTITWGAGDVIEGPVVREVMHQELVGRPAARQGRKVLGQLRLLRRDVHQSLDSLRLLRQSRDEKAFLKAARYFKAHGPLMDLRTEALTVMQNRPTSWWRGVDVQALVQGAELLTPDEASTGYELLAAAFLEDYRDPGARFGIEAKASAIGALADTSGRHNDLAALIHMAASDGLQDQMFMNAYARALTYVDWTFVDDNVKERWSLWLNDETGEPDRTSLRLLIASAVGLSEGSASNDLSLESIGAALNSDLRYPETQLTKDLANAFGQKIAQVLDDVRVLAKRGQYNFGGIDVARLGASLALRRPELIDLWRAICDYVTDAALPRELKAQALDRLAVSAKDIPEFALAQLSDGVAGILTSRTLDFSRWRTSSEGPFPSGLRFIAATGVASETRLLSGVLALSTAEAPLQRVEAAKTLGLLVRRSQQRVWGDALLLQLCRDRDATVRAHAGYGLAQSRLSNPELSELWETVITELLQEDGVLVPLLVLQGLSAAQHDDPRRISSGLTLVIRSLGESSLASSVREAAAAALNSADPGD